jgi:transposase InsO family protein
LRSSTRTASPASSGLADNAWAYRKGLAWKQALAEIGATGKLTRAYRPQRNCKVERFNRPLLDE